MGRKLSAEECEQIIAYVEQLEVEAKRSPMEAEKVLGSILKPLLASEGLCQNNETFSDMQGGVSVAGGGASTALGGVRSC
jgi:hypothetical protein